MVQSSKVDKKKTTLHYQVSKVVYRKKGVISRPVYSTTDEIGIREYYIKENGKYHKVLYNPWNGFYYKQEGE